MFKREFGTDAGTLNTTATRTREYMRSTAVSAELGLPMPVGQWDTVQLSFSSGLSSVGKVSLCFPRTYLSYVD